MNKKTLVIFILGIIIFFGVKTLNKSSFGKSAKKDAEEVPVLIANVIKKSMPLEVVTFGTVEPNTTVAVKPMISGMLNTIHFKEGEDVKKGELLFTIDPRPFESALKQAEAVLARDKTQQLNARAELARQEKLLQKGFASEDIRDQARTASDVLSSAIKADEALVNNAKLQLEYCYIHSPVDGRTGKHMVDEGNIVKANDLPLVVINQMKPIKIKFTIPQSDLPKVIEKTKTDKLNVQAFIPGNHLAPSKGVLSFVDNTIDTTTGTIMLEATFSNEDARLWPGLFVDIIMTLDMQNDALVIPTNAVQSGQKGTYAYTVKNDMSVDYRLVEVERIVGDETVIKSGLNIGEQVVTDGHLRLTPKSKVKINDSSSPSKEKPVKKESEEK